MRAGHPGPGRRGGEHVEVPRPGGSSALHGEWISEGAPSAGQGIAQAVPVPGDAVAGILARGRHVREQELARER